MAVGSSGPTSASSLPAKAARAPSRSSRLIITRCQAASRTSGLRSCAPDLCCSERCNKGSGLDQICPSLISMAHLHQALSGSGTPIQHSACHLQVDRPSGPVVISSCWLPATAACSRSRDRCRRRGGIVPARAANWASSAVGPMLLRSCFCSARGAANSGASGRGATSFRYGCSSAGACR